MIQAGPADVAAWCRAADTDRELRAYGAGVELQFALADETGESVFTVSGGGFVPGGDRPVFTLRAKASDWRLFFSPTPPPEHHNWFAMAMRRGAEVTGDRLRFAQHVQVVRRFLDLGRRLAGPAEEPPVPAASKAAITGRYVRIVAEGETCDVYVEQAGTGPDLLLLHTAGADGRQFHGLMAQPAIAGRCRLTAFDLPGHGRSDPLPSQLAGDYALTTDAYAAIVIAVADALELERPVLCGASMAGLICLELAYRARERFGGVVACSAADRVPGRTIAWAKDPLVNQALFVPEWIYGLSAATSPKRHRDEIWWQYSQGGYGGFAGDIAFYSGDFDARDRVAAIDTTSCPVVMMTGEYDYSCTVAMSRSTAARIPGAVFHPMPGLGHFPMTENPPLFATHLSRALDEIGV